MQTFHKTRIWGYGVNNESHDGEEMNIKTITLSLALVLSLVFTGAPLHASPQKVMIQLKYFMLPVINAAGQQRTEPVTIFLQVPHKDHVKIVCRLVPRVRDAVMQVLMAHPLRKDKNKVSAKISRQVLIDYVNHSIGAATVSGFQVVRGARSFGKGSASKLPGAKLGCMRVLAFAR